MEKLESLIQQQEEKPEDYESPYGEPNNQDSDKKVINISDMKRSPRPSSSNVLQTAETLILGK